MTKLVILGTRTLAVEIADVASEVPGIEVAGFVENMDRAKCSTDLEGLPVYWIDDVPALAATHMGVCALGTTRRSAFVEQAQSLGLRFTTIIHPSARVSRNSTVGEGSILCPGVIVATHTHVGRHVLLNRGALIGHHTRIGDYCSLMPGSNVAGACDIGEKTYVGMGSIIMDHRTVGSNSLIAAGAVVAADVADNVQVAGVPARVVRKDIEGR
jgi:sugar O-acyltransferase (sialic acid O-acetyltransferase NeuD family)